MRKLESKEEIERKRKFRTTILSLLMLFILILSTLGFAFLSNTKTTQGNTGNQQQNQQNTGQINFQYQGNLISLVSTYESIANIPVNISIYPQFYSGSILYIDSTNQGILQELGSTLGRLSSRVQEACYGKCERNLPEKNCADNLIVWKESSEDKVFQIDNCVFIEGDISSVDAFIYKLFNK